jgi:hypothetical protein
MKAFTAEIAETLSRIKGQCPHYDQKGIQSAAVLGIL